MDKIKNTLIPVPTNFEPIAERTSPSLIGVSTPLERTNAITTTIRNKPADLSAFFIFDLSLAIPLSEKIKVTVTAIKRVI